VPIQKQTEKMQNKKEQNDEIRNKTQYGISSA
jgi:hypothetical protein